MTTKTKAVAMFAMLPLLMAGFIGPSFAEPNTQEYTGEAVEDALESLMPYVTVNENKIAHLDVANAIENGLSWETIGIGFDFIQMQNKMIQKIHDYPDAKLKLDSEDKEKFKNFFDKVQKGEVKKKDKITRTSYLDFLLPIANAADVCGGSESNPHPAPTVTQSGSYTDRTAAINALSGGYNQVPAYASGNYPDDYADWVSAYSCADGVFRYQTIVYDAGSEWKHSNQHSPGEPNPEVLAYWWPVYWWSSYTSWWHDNF